MCLSSIGEGERRGSPGRLLEGYLTLKRDLAIELLATCCEHTSERELDLLQEACSALGEAARWEQEPRRWAQR